MNNIIILMLALVITACGDNAFNASVDNEKVNQTETNIDNKNEVERTDEEKKKIAEKMMDVTDEELEKLKNEW